MKLIGRYLDREIIFDFIAEENGRYLFRTQIPPVESGEVVLELFAIDDAGNVGTHRQALILIDFKSLSINVLENNLNAKQERTEFEAKLISNSYRCKEILLNEKQSRPFFSEYQVVVCCAI